jgi:hypothetical protein
MYRAWSVNGSETDEALISQTDQRLSLWRPLVKSLKSVKDL